MPTRPIKIFSSQLRYFRRKMLVYESWNFVQSTGWILASGFLLLLIAERLLPIRNMNFILVGFVFVWIVSIVVNLIFIPKSPLRIAWRVDQDLNLKERLSSAIEFSQSIASEVAITSQFITKQRQETLSKLYSVSKKSAFILQYSPKHIISASMICVTAIILSVIPNPMDGILRQQEEIATAAEKQAEIIQEMVEDLNSEQGLSQEEQEKLIKELENLAEKLRENNGDLSEALADLSKTEDSILKRLEPQREFRQNSINSISQQLSSLASQNDPDLESLEDTAELMESLLEQLTKMDSANKNEMIDSLQKMAIQAAQAGESNLSQALSQLSQSAQSDDMGQTSKIAEIISETLDQAKAEISDQKTIESTLSQLQQVRAALNQTTAARNSNQNQTPGNQSSQSGDSNQGQSPRSNSGAGPGQGNSQGSGGGTKADLLPGFTGTGSASDPTGATQGSQSGFLEDQLFVPWERLQENSDQLSISGTETDQGQTEVREQNSPLPGSHNFSLVPYSEVYGSYLNTAYDTIENSLIPFELKEYIRNYFLKLEP